MVDVIIPTYKARETLPKALDSLVAQTKKLFIVTIVQDADGEDYTDIIEEYRRRGLVIRWIPLTENKGPGGARQAGMDSDRMCEYFMFLDADDMLMPRAVELLSREITLHNADIASSDFIAERKATPGVLMDVFEVPVTWCHGRIYRAEYLRKNNIRFLEGLRINEDAYFNLIAHNCTKNKIKLKEVTYLWRDNKNSLTRASSNEEFFKRTWETYITSQVEALLRIIELKGEVTPDLLGATLLYVYHYWMIAKHYKVINDSIILELLKLKNNPVLINSLKEEAFWQHITQNLKGCTFWGDNIIFYKDRFIDWLKDYIADSIV
jgi:glycosyltransferase involved in cell wall biosynthesis